MGGEGGEDKGADWERTSENAQAGTLVTNHRKVETRAKWRQWGSVELEYLDISPKLSMWANNIQAFIDTS